MATKKKMGKYEKRTQSRLTKRTREIAAKQKGAAGRYGNVARNVGGTVTYKRKPTRTEDPTRAMEGYHKGGQPRTKGSFRGSINAAVRRKTGIGATKKKTTKTLEKKGANGGKKKEKKSLVEQGIDAIKREKHTGRRWPGMGRR